MMKFILIFIFIFFGFFVFNVTYAQAATYYVCSSGCDYSTIQAAANIVNPGDTVIIKDGTYTTSGDTLVNLTRSGTASNWITFKAENKWGAILDGRNNSTMYGWFTNGNYNRIEGFEVKGFKQYGFRNNQNSKHHIYFYRNLVHDIGRYNSGGGSPEPQGFSGKGSSTYFTWDSNVIHTIGRLSGTNRHDHGIYVGGDHMTVINNVFYNITVGWPLHPMSSSGRTISDWFISNNTFADANPERDGQIVMSYQPYHDFIIQNNIFYQAKNDGIRFVSAPLTNVVIRNNISTNEISNSSNGATYTDNLANQNILLVDPLNADYRLQSGSLAINAGISTDAPSTDHDGNPRPQGLAYDIGAYEYGGTQPTTQTCTSFTYSDWSPTTCPVSETQTRTVTSSSPSGCTGGNPDLTQSCVYTPTQAYQCSDTIDNDGDGLIDMNDLGCTSTTDDDEYNIPPSSTVFSTIDSYIGDSTNWQPLTPSRWEVTTDSGNLRYGINTTNYSGPSTSHLGEYSLIKNRTYDDFTFEAKVKSTENLTSNNFTDYAIVFNYQDSNNYHFVLFNSDISSNNINKVVNSQVQEIISANTSLITDNNYHVVKLEKTGTNIKVYFDNTEILNTTDTTPSQGQIGIGSINDASLWDDITVTIPTTLQGDLNQDGTVNALDWSIMNANWGTSDTTADINNDGVVNTIDFSILNSEWGQTIT